MLGLLVKDIKLLVGQKQFFFAIILISCVFLVMGEDPMFLVSYCTMIFAFFTISTMSYDEFNHGLLFLFTLPISRRVYVLEKYLFGLGIGGFVWLVTTIIGGSYGMASATEFVMTDWVVGAISVLFVLSLFLCVVLPLQFKFGAEKGRTALFVFMAAVFASFTAFMKIEGLADMLDSKILWLQSLGSFACGLIAVAFWLVAVVVSISVSLHIVEKKQFS